MTKPKKVASSSKMPVTLTLAEAVEHHARAVERLAKTHEEREETIRGLIEEALKRVDEIKEQWASQLNNPPPSPMRRPPSDEEIKRAADEYERASKAGGA